MSEARTEREDGWALGPDRRANRPCETGLADYPAGTFVLGIFPVFSRITRSPDRRGGQLAAARLSVSNSIVLVKKSGAGDEIRTHDFNLGKVALYP